MVSLHGGGFGGDGDDIREEVWEGCNARHHYDELRKQTSEICLILSHTFQPHHLTPPTHPLPGSPLRRCSKSGRMDRVSSPSCCRGVELPHRCAEPPAWIPEATRGKLRRTQSFQIRAEPPRHVRSWQGALAGSRIHRGCPAPGGRLSRWTSGGPYASSRSSRSRPCWTAAQ